MRKIGVASELAINGGDFPRTIQKTSMNTAKKRKFTKEFKHEAVRLTETGCWTVAQVAGDLGIGKSTLMRWKTQFKEADVLSGPHDEVNRAGIVGVYCS